MLGELLHESSKALVEPIAVLKGGHTDWVTFARFVDADHVVTASWDKTVRLWDLRTHDSTLLLTERDKVASANFSANRERFVTAIWNGYANVRMRDGALLSNFGHGGQRVNWADFSPDGLRVVTACDDNTARIWTLNNSNSTYLTLSGHEGFVKTAVFDQAGQRVLTASFDYTAKIWDATSGQRLLTLAPHPDGVNAAAFSPDGKVVATGCLDGSIWLWDTSKIDKDGRVQQPAMFARHAGTKPRVNSVAFNADGTRLLTTSDDHTAKIWEVATGELLLSFEQHSNIVVNGGFSPDGHRAVTASKDKTAMIFDADPKTRTLEEIVMLAEKLTPRVAPTEARTQTVARK
jgi:WD40 repeat protein